MNPRIANYSSPYQPPDSKLFFSFFLIERARHGGVRDENHEQHSRPCFHVDTDRISITV